MAGKIAFLLAASAFLFGARGDDEAFIREWEDENMGVAFTMIDTDRWYSGKWGVIQEHMSDFQPWAQSYLSITTKSKDMAVYKNQPYGLALHITEDMDFWRDFEVIGHGQNRIVGGPADGGSHTPGTHDWRIPATNPSVAWVDYNWFTEQKNGILAQYNTVFHNHDYNEFIVNGIRSSAIAGVFKYYRSSKREQDTINDWALCNFLNMHAGWRQEPWPVYGYNWGELKIERFLSCQSFSAKQNATSATDPAGSFSTKQNATSAVLV